MTRRHLIFDIFAILTISIAVIVPQYYLQVTQVNLEATQFVQAVVFPILLGSAILLAGRSRILLFSFLAYMPSVTDDAPVYLDSVFTWPEVTSGFQHVFLEILLHVLTLVFMTLAIREALKGRIVTHMKILRVSILTLIAFLLSYTQNLPFDFIRTYVENCWFQLDIIEHLASMIFLYLAIREAMA